MRSRSTHLFFRALFAVLSTAIGATSPAQVLCVYCYQQNPAIDTTGVNLVLNGSFEATDCVPGFEDHFCPASSTYSCDIADWTCTGGGSLTYAQMVDATVCPIPDGTVAAYIGNNMSRVCSEQEGDTLCLLRNGCTVAGIPNGYPTNAQEYGGTTGVRLSQTIPGLIPSATYILEFWAGGEGGYSEPGVFAVNVGFGNIFLRCKPTYGSETGTRYQVVFTASGTSHTITFTNWGHMMSDATELTLDDVRLTLSSLAPCLPASLSDGIAGAHSVTLLGDHLLVDVTGRKDGWLTLSDATGRSLLQQQVSGTMNIDMLRYAVGVYSYQLYVEGERPMVGRFLVH